MTRFPGRPYSSRFVYAIGLFVILALAGCARQGPVVSSTSPSTACQWHVYFSPNGGATDAVVNALADAKKTVLVQAYSFTSQPIAKALLTAKKRGVDVRILLDKSQVTQKYSSAAFFHNVGINPWIDYEHAIAHNKVMVIDDATVITGSFNFTKAAEQKNAENLLIIDDPKLAAAYTKNWNTHRNHSEPYQGREGQ